jgi:hypothetical protein
MTEPGAYLPPGRSLEWVRPVPGGIEFLCDCATITVLEVEADPGAKTQEIAVTCDGCLTAHWFTVIPPPPAGGCDHA